MSKPKTANAHSYTEAQPEVAVPRPSASLVLVNPQNEVLLVHRTRGASTFANAHVFPGGNIDPQDKGSFELCAIRETFEEAGLLLTETPPNPSVDLTEIRKQIHRGTLKFTDFLKRERLVADVSKLIPFTTWITPPTMKKRFHTRMYLSFLASPTAESTETALPTHDGGIETISATFYNPNAALTLMQAGSMILFPPQAYLLNRLSPFLIEGSSNVEAKRQVDAWLKEENVSGYVFRPQPEGKTKDGRIVLGYGPEGDPRRKSIVMFGKGGLPSGVQIALVEEVSKL